MEGGGRGNEEGSDEGGVAEGGGREREGVQFVKQIPCIVLSCKLGWPQVCMTRALHCIHNWHTQTLLYILYSKRERRSNLDLTSCPTSKI